MNAFQSHSHVFGVHLDFADFLKNSDFSEFPYCFSLGLLPVQYIVSLPTQSSVQSQQTVI